MQGVKLLAILAALAAMSGEAVAQLMPNSFRSDPFSALVGKRRTASERAEAEAVERYVIASDDRVFLFQSGSKIGRLKFLCGDRDPRIDCRIDTEVPAEEIYIIVPTRASRGDTVWNEVDGKTLLRIAAYGGSTVFWPGDLRGHAASKSFGEDPALKLDAATIETARKRAQRATAILSAQAGAPIIFEIGDPPLDANGGASVLADAVVRAAKGVSEVARDPTGARVIAERVNRVEFAVADAAASDYREGVLIIQYNPALDVEGRPSSAAIVRFLEGRL